MTFPDIFVVTKTENRFDFEHHTLWHKLYFQHYIHCTRNTSNFELFVI
jgi:hypothetical protein